MDTNVRNAASGGSNPDARETPSVSQPVQSTPPRADPTVISIEDGTPLITSSRPVIQPALDPDDWRDLIFVVREQAKLLREMQREKQKESRQIPGTGQPSTPLDNLFPVFPPGTVPNPAHPVNRSQSAILQGTQNSQDTTMSNSETRTPMESMAGLTPHLGGIPSESSACLKETPSIPVRIPM